VCLFFLSVFNSFLIYLLKKRPGNIIDVHKIVQIDASAKTLQARMLKLHTRTLQTPALIVMAWCAARATLVCVTER
jgi:hypothetical protein